MIRLVYAHPYPDRSRGNRALLRAVSDLPGVEVCALYDLYPDFAIDVEREQAALSAASAVVLQHPLYWYSVPGLLKHFFDKVLTRGYAYGNGGRALAGKPCLWVATTGGDTAAYAEGALHARPFADYVPPIEQTARFCGMLWQAPIIVHGVHQLSPAELAARCEDYRARLTVLLEREGGTP